MCLLCVYFLYLSHTIPIETMMTCFRSTFFWLAGWLLGWFCMCHTNKKKLDPLILFFFQMKGNQVNTNRRIFRQYFEHSVVFVSCALSVRVCASFFAYKEIKFNNLLLCKLYELIFWFCGRCSVCWWFVRVGVELGAMSFACVTLLLSLYKYSQFAHRFFFLFSRLHCLGGSVSFARSIQL